ncbi:MAG: patatin-like phospholipase family protein [Dehalococcoidales bacterium]|nr:patatin-like phospholipase family protein [Dehalococcoidales bacterium]
MLANSGTNEPGRKKVGLALGSGAARGLAHVGVLAALEKRGIPVDLIAGTSIGAIIGAAYAAGKDVSEIKKAVSGLNRRQMLSLADFTIPTKGFIKGKRMTDWFKSVIGDVNFKDLKIPFACVATDIETGEEVVIRQGSVAAAARASASLPVIFTPTRLGGRYLVDGGLVNPIPVRLLREMGAELVIAVNVVPYLSNLQKPTETTAKVRPKEPNIFGVLIRMVYIVGYQAALAGIREADVTIAPNVAHIRPDNFNRARECILQGERAARRAIPEIERLLKA